MAAFVEKRPPEFTGSLSCSARTSAEPTERESLTGAERRPRGRDRRT